MSSIHQSLAKFLEKYLFALQPKTFDYSPPKIALAVSGGADSMGLLHLLIKYHFNEQLKITIFSVDHQLRSDSSQDLAFVKLTANQLRLPFYDLIWQQANPLTNIQEKARLARYKLMTNQCHKLGINILLTAHHYDDFLENYLMKKKRHYSLLGLSNSNITYMHNIQILRPFYHVRKSDILTFLRTNNLKWREDPSNQKIIYERNQLRKTISLLPANKLKYLIKEAEIINKQALTKNQELLETLAKQVEFSNFGFAKLYFSSEITIDLLIYLLNHLLIMISGKLAPPRYRSVKKIIEKLLKIEDFTVSLHGCILKNMTSSVQQRENSTLLIFREKATLASDISYQQHILWDNRFHFSGKEIISDSYKIGKLNEQNYHRLKKELDLSSLQKITNNQHHLLLFTLPTVKKLEKVIAIPHISYYDKDIKFRVNCYFAPKFTSRFTHFL